MKTIIPLILFACVIAACENDEVHGTPFDGPGGPAQPTITTTTLPQGTVGVAYNAAITASGGTGMGYTWTLTAGALPTGLAMAPTGTPATAISGTPTQDGMFLITVRVTDSDARYTNVTLQLVILPASPPALGITSNPAMPDATVGQAYTESVTATGGTGGYTWAVIDGEVPPGLAVASNGTPSTAVTGTPTAFGAFYFTVEVTDSSSISATLDVTLIVVVSATADSWVGAFTMVDDRGSAAVFTGSRIIQWGGEFNADGTGDVMFPGAGTTSAITTTGAPTARAEHTAVWTGRRMIVWGGHDGATYFADGASYDPVGDAWSPINNTTAAARSAHSAVWTGNEMIIWGGLDSAAALLDDGYAYNPSTDTWRTLAAVPSGMQARERHRAIWTGSLMLVWGGFDAILNPLFDGGAYDPATDTWAPITSTGAPTLQAYEAAIVWTGTRLFVWGCDSNPAMQGAEWNPATNSWTTIGTWFMFRRHAAAVAIPTGVFVWGGLDFYATAPSNDGEFYNHGIQNWQTMAGTTLYVRWGARAYWTGRQIIVWGGKDFGFAGTPPYADGAVYQP